MKSRRLLKKMLICFCIFGGIILFVGLVFSIIYGAQIKFLLNNADQKIASINSSTFRSRESTIIYDKDGNVLKKLAIHDYAYTDIKDVPTAVSSAIMAIEDKRFYEHDGVDIQAYLRVLARAITSKGKDIQGGSTITQQLVKNVFLSNEKTITRKLEEIIIALKIEKMYSKEQIMEFYINNIYYGNGIYGIGTASNDYFNKSPKDLTLPEIAFLTGIPNNPSQYDPIKNYDNADERKNIILSNMKQLHFISEAEYQDAIKTKVKLDLPKKEYEPDSYDVSYAINETTKVLMQQSGFEFKYSFNTNAERDKYFSDYSTLYKQMDRKIRNGGYSIYTSIDVQKQKLLQDSLDSELSVFTEKDSKTGLYETQGAGVSIDNKTGQVVAIVGGRTQENTNNSFNRAYLAFRQPGSSIKPLIAYTPAFDLGKMPFTVMQDKYITNGPKNEEGQFYGSVTLRYATELSLNTIPYQLLLENKPQNMIPYLTKMQFTRITPEDNTAVIALGGFTVGVSPLEMAGGYSTLSRNGVFIPPTALVKVEDINHDVIYENTHEKTPIYKPESAFLMTDVLEGVVNKSYATGYGKAISGVPTAGKTGTTDGSKDGWFAGYTPLYTTAVWVGNDNPQEIKNLFGSSYPGQIWYDYMSQIHKDVSNVDFTVPSNMYKMKVNPYSGAVYSENSYNWGNEEWVTGAYAQEHQPSFDQGNSQQSNSDYKNNSYSNQDNLQKSTGSENNTKTNTSDTQPQQSSEPSTNANTPNSNSTKTNINTNQNSTSNSNQSQNQTQNQPTSGQTIEKPPQVKSP